jgi:hypothetical protein
MASPSSESSIPKGSNPEGGSGNLSASSGATPPAQASETPTTMPQTANNPDQASGSAATTDTGSASDNSASSGTGSSSTDSMPQGKYASPPDLGAQH